MKRPLAFALRVLAAAACTLAAFAASAQLASGDRHFLWEVIGVSNRAYLFGTVHAGKKDWYPLPPVIEEAFNESRVLVVEADITDVNAMAKAAPSMVYKAPETLKDHVTAQQYERFRKLLPRYSIPEGAILQMKPFMAVSTLVFSEWGRLGYLPELGIDGYLIRKARADLKPVVEIEGVESQMKLMDALTDAEQREVFEGTIKALEMGLTGEQITGMVNAWQSGDPDLMLEIARRYNENVPGAKEFEEKFVWSRHEEMVKKIEGYLTESKDRHFIAVGSLHLAGPRGLVEMLRKRGYIVRQR
jgi:uncharacterized protein YbaP (TraB family)